MLSILNPDYHHSKEKLRYYVLIQAGQGYALQLKRSADNTYGLEAYDSVEDAAACFYSLTQPVKVGRADDKRVIDCFAHLLNMAPLIIGLSHGQNKLSELCGVHLPYEGNEAYDIPRSLILLKGGWEKYKVLDVLQAACTYRNANLPLYFEQNEYTTGAMYVLACFNSAGNFIVMEPAPKEAKMAAGTSVIVPYPNETIAEGKFALWLNLLRMGDPRDPAFTIAIEWLNAVRPFILAFKNGWTEMQSYIVDMGSIHFNNQLRFWDTLSLMKVKPEIKNVVVKELQTTALPGLIRIPNNSPGKPDTSALTVKWADTIDNNKDSQSPANEKMKYALILNYKGTYYLYVEVTGRDPDTGGIVHDITLYPKPEAQGTFLDQWIYQPENMNAAEVMSNGIKVTTLNPAFIGCVGGKNEVYGYLANNYLTPAKGISDKEIVYMMELKPSIKNLIVESAQFPAGMNELFRTIAATVKKASKS